MLVLPAKDRSSEAESRDHLRGEELPTVAEHRADRAQRHLPGTPSYPPWQSTVLTVLKDIYQVRLATHRGRAPC